MTRRYTIGKHGPLPPDQARNRARELAAMVAHGIDPRQIELDAIAAADESKREAETKLEGELASVWQATETLRAPLGAFYRVLMLTGQRREEVAGMTWAELDRTSATWIIPADKAKNGVVHILPLAPAVLEELDRLALALQVKAKAEELDAKRWPKAVPVMSFTGKVALSCFSQAKTLLDAEVAKVRKHAKPIKPWRVHDLRRTIAYRSAPADRQRGERRAAYSKATAR